jgi:hypothetical protein
MEMTPDKLAFIKGEGSKQTGSPAKAAAPVAAVEKVIDVEPSGRPSEPFKEASPKVNRRSSRRATQESLAASEVLDQVLVPVTIRVPHRTAQALRRAYLEQRLKHVKPDTQQEIVEEALGDWLFRHGFLE